VLTNSALPMLLGVQDAKQLAAVQGTVAACRAVPCHSVHSRAGSFDTGICHVRLAWNIRQPFRGNVGAQSVFGSTVQVIEIHLCVSERSWGGWWLVVEWSHPFAAPKERVGEHTEEKDVLGLSASLRSSVCADAVQTAPVLQGPASCVLASGPCST
jgi:hypothetical protein